jgi:hypothetical protein
MHWDDNLEFALVVVCASILAWPDSCHSFLVAIRSVQADTLAAAIAVALHSCSLVVADIVIVPVVAVVDAVEEAVAASIDHAMVVESEDPDRQVSGVEEGVLVPDSLVLESPMLCQRPGRCVAILWAVEVLVVEVVARAHCAVVVALIAPAVPSRRRLAGLLGSRTMLISGVISASHAFILNAPSGERFGAQHTYIPVLRPLSQVWVVYPPVSAHMLPRAHHHVL